MIAVSWMFVFLKCVKPQLLIAPMSQTDWSTDKDLTKIWTLMVPGPEGVKAASDMGIMETH